MSDYQNILFSVEGAVATLTLNVPETMNALTIAMMDEVGDVLTRIENDKSIRALILTGSGRGFCSGQNLKDRIPPGSDLTGVLMDSYFRAINGIRNCRVPVVVAVNGTAAGGGFSVALCGDFLIAARSAKFIQVFSRIALGPDLGSTYLLPRAIGRARALQLMMTNDPLDAETAAEWGLIAEVLDDDKLMGRAREIANRLATGPTYALHMTRRMVDEGEANSFEQQFRRELETNSELRDTHDSQEGVQAFNDKRQAVFRGE